MTLKEHFASGPSPPKKPSLNYSVSDQHHFILLALLSLILNLDMAKEIPQKNQKLRLLSQKGKCFLTLIFLTLFVHNLGCIKRSFVKHSCQFLYNSTEQFLCRRPSVNSRSLRLRKIKILTTDTLADIGFQIYSVGPLQ